METLVTKLILVQYCRVTAKQESKESHEELQTNVVQLGDYTATLLQMQTINEGLSQMRETLKEGRGASYDLLKSFKS